MHLPVFEFWNDVPHFFGLSASLHLTSSRSVLAAELDGGGAFTSVANVFAFGRFTSLVGDSVAYFKAYKDDTGLHPLQLQLVARKQLKINSIFPHLCRSAPPPAVSRHTYARNVTHTYRHGCMDRSRLAALEAVDPYMDLA